METTTWFDLVPGYGVLEVHEKLTTAGPALELHVMRDETTGASIAWWEPGKTCLTRSLQAVLGTALRGGRGLPLRVRIATENGRPSQGQAWTRWT